MKSATMNVFENREVASTYDAWYQDDFGRRVDAIERSLMQSVMANIPPGKMLEIGCGTGHWTRFFSGLGFDVLAVDPSVPMLEQAAKKKLSATLKQAQAERLPFPDASFNCIAAVTVIEFVRDRDRVFEEMHRVLAPGGWLVLGCLSADSVLARNSAGDPVFCTADFMTQSQLARKLEAFGRPEFRLGVYLSEEGSLLDDAPERDTAEPAFMAASVRKRGEHVRIH